MFRLPRKLLLLGGAAAVSVSGFAFMASNSLGPSWAGEGSHQVSGYTVSNIVYSGIHTAGGGQVGAMQFNGSAPVSGGLTGDGIVTQVQFTVNPDNALWSEVQLYNSAKQVIGGGGASNCNETGGTWTCDVTGATGYGNGAAWSNQSGAPVSQIAYIDVEAVH